MLVDWPAVDDDLGSAGRCATAPEAQAHVWAAATKVSLLHV